MRDKFLSEQVLQHHERRCTRSDSLQNETPSYRKRLKSPLKRGDMEDLFYITVIGQYWADNNVQYMSKTHKMKNFHKFSL